MSIKVKLGLGERTINALDRVPRKRDCIAYDVARNEVLQKAFSEARSGVEAERDQLRAAVQATLELADRLYGYAEGGAGFVGHWGERVLQAVEPLRDVNRFRDHTLEQNKLLLDSNGEFIERAGRLRALLERAELLVEELNVPPVFADERIRWVEIQVARETPEEAKALLAEIRKELGK